MSIYLDHNSTSPMHPEVIDAMMPYLQNPVGNPSSLHSYGRMARSAVESARAEVAQLLGCESSAIVFTSGGTENVAGVVGLGKAAQVARLEIAHKKHHLEQLRNVFESRLASIPGSMVFGQQAPRLPNTTFFALPFYHGETLLMELDRAGFALSSGPACHSAVTEPSHVLKAMGVDDSLALNAIRVSFGMDNSLQDVEKLVAKLHELVNRLPALVRQAAV